MAVIAEISLPSTDFVLGQLLSDERELHVEFERIVSLGNETCPLFWVRHGEVDGFERRLAGCDAVDEYTALERFDDRVLYAVRWEPPSNGFLYGLDEANAVALRARWCDDGQWRLKLLFPSHEELSAFHEFCLDNEIRCTLGRIYPLDDSTSGRNVDSLTAEQREAISLALREGYFDTPSRTTLSQLSTQLEISQQALSQRIRRGTKAVFEEILSDADGP
ncbi:helix-turn-helix domain-containing protein [Haloprofundus salilacus]|uniref:helix-turn-helix domain-containing protein n=1 Tax=Haloprofundus salilacus TaxID=2876190 RepID=UPI001CCC291B|nr:helix-turn-helix domain-containing protein [Haloprofundus salilacus]